MTALNIRQLLDRYWQCQTSLEEEAQLRDYFAQGEVEADLLPYRNLFLYEAEASEECPLGADFDERMMALISEEKEVKATTIRLWQRFVPLMRAAAVVIFVLLFGNLLQTSFNQPGAEGATAGIEQTKTVGNVARTDSVSVDSMKQSFAKPVPAEAERIRIK